MKFWETGKKIVAVGRNYVAHAKELNNPVPGKPFFFLKPTSSYITQGSSIEVPPGEEVHHEVELGVVIGVGGRDISEGNALSHVAGYTLALDLTARNQQNYAKQNGLPWSAAKGYDTFCPVSGFIPKEKIPNPHNIDLWLKIDGQFKQQGNTNQMIFSIPKLIAYISTIMRLDPGDLVLTGTPQGVGPIAPGQVVTAGISGVTEMTFPVVARKPAGSKL